VAIFSSNFKAATVFTVFAGLLLMFAAYVFFSPDVRGFQRKASDKTPR
jgi:hypothetical protein